MPLPRFKRITIIKARARNDEKNYLLTSTSSQMNNFESSLWRDGNFLVTWNDKIDSRLFFCCWSHRIGSCRTAPLPMLVSRPSGTIFSKYHSSPIMRSVLQYLYEQRVPFFEYFPPVSRCTLLDTKGPSSSGLWYHLKQIHRMFHQFYWRYVPFHRWSCTIEQNGDDFQNWSYNPKHSSFGAFHSCYKIHFFCNCN